MPISDKHLDRDAQRKAQSFMGEVAWPTVALGATCVTVYTSVLIAAALGAIPLWVSFILVSISVYASYTVVHEAVHGSIHGKAKSLRWLNDLMGYLCAQPFGIAFTAHKKEHLAHHRHTNIAGQDPDLGLVNRGFWGLIRGTVSNLYNQIRHYRHYHWQTASLRQRTLFIGEYGVAIAWRLVFVWLAGWKVSLVLLLGATYAGAIILLTSFAWIVHRGFDRTDRYRDTSTIIFPKAVDGPITWLWLFQNYHSIHHLFPRVPFYRYRQLFNEIEDIMIEKGAPIFRVGQEARATSWPDINAAL